MSAGCAVRESEHSVVANRAPLDRSGSSGGLVLKSLRLELVPVTRPEWPERAVVFHAEFVNETNAPLTIHRWEVRSALQRVRLLDDRGEEWELKAPMGMEDAFICF